MDTLLMLLGFSIFAAGSALYFNLAIKRGGGWLLGSLLFPPVMVWFHRRFWEKTRLAGYVQLAGLAFLSFGFLAGAHSHPEKFAHPIMRPLVGWLASGQPSTENAMADIHEIMASLRDNNGKLGGRLWTTPFVLERAEFDNGVMRLIDTRHQQDISLFLGVDATALPVQWSRSIAPDQIGVTLQLRSPDGTIQSFNSGYKLNLRLNKLSEFKVAGNIELLLNDQRRSFVAGVFEAASSQARLRGGEVDRTLENDDTIYFVIKHYLRSNFPEQVQQVIALDQVRRHYQNGVLHANATARLKMRDGQEHRFDIYAIKYQQGWEVSENNSTQLLAALQSMTLAPPAAGKPMQTAQPRIRVLDASDFMRRAAEFIGHKVELELVGGQRQRGVLDSIEPHALVLRPASPGGEPITLSVRRDNLLRAHVPPQQ